MTKRILHIYKDYAPVLGGIENHVRALAEAQAAAGYDVTVLVNSLDVHTRREELGGVHVIKAGRLFTLASTPISLALPLLLGRQHPDLVHLHFPYPWGEVSNLLFGRPQRLVVMYHSDIVKQQGLLRWYRPLLWRTLHRADRIIATSAPYIASSPFLSQVSDKCVAIPLGIDLRRFEAADPAKVQEIEGRFPGRRLLFVGRLRYYKGLEYLLRALPDVDARLLIVGDGPMRAPWQELTHTLGLDDRVTFLTDVPDEDLPAYYHASEIFVLPSHLRSEGFGTVLLEAMAAGRPLVTTELGTGTSWVNQHGVTGLVVPPADPPALAAAIRRLLADDALRAGMGRAARARAEAEFTLERMIARVDDLYRELLT